MAFLEEVCMIPDKPKENILKTLRAKLGVVANFED